MATKNSTGTPKRADQAGTAPLPPAAVAALSRLELKLAAVRYRDASELCSSLSKSGDVEGCLTAQDEMAMCRCQLAAAGRLDLIGVSA